MKLSLFIIIIYGLSAWGGQLQAQSRINIKIHAKPPQFFTAADSANLFVNKYIDREIMDILQNQKAVRVSIADSLQVEQIIYQIRSVIGSYGRLVRERRDNSDAEKLALLREANLLVEKGLKLKPTDANLIRYLKLISPAYEPFLRKEEDYHTFVNVATRRLYLAEPEKQYSVFFALGDAYYRMDDYELSRHAYDQAVESLFEFYEDSLVAENATFTTYLYRSLTGRATAEEKLYLNSAALRSWRHALVVAPEEHKANIEMKINRTLLWDDGNLIAYEKRNQAMELFRDKAYLEAKKQFTQLLPTLHTHQARAEINRLIAQIEFTFLDDPDAGLERMHQIVLEYPKYVIVSDSVVDSTYLNYQQTYAQLCYFQGIREMRLNRTREAFIYLAKAAEFESKFQALATFSLAVLLSRDRNSVMHSEKIISYGLQAWDGELTDNYRKNLANIISFAYQQQGSFQEAISWKNRSLEIN